MKKVMLVLINDLSYIALTDYGLAKFLSKG